MLIWLALPALAQDYRFPIADDDVEFAYPTAYKDHDGVDWSCGDVFYAGHQGSDFGVGGWDGMDAGRTIVAAAPGIVTETNDGEFDRCETGDCGTTYGNHVWIQHADGKSTVYGHMKSGSVLVQVGDVVQCGQPLGLVGSSGHATGPHLHFGVLDGGAFVDPFWGDCSAAPSYWVDQGDYKGVPGTTCDDPPECEPVAALGCGDHVERGADEGGTTSTHAFYGACTDFAEYSGAEVAYTIVPDRDGPVVIAMSGVTADLDLFALASAACDATDCLAASTEGDTSDESLTVDGHQGEPLTVVIDGFRDASSGFALDVTCQGEAPDTDVDTDGSGPKCGCDSSASAGAWLGALAVALSITRRRARS